MIMRLYLKEYNAGYNQPPPYVQQPTGYVQQPTGYAQQPTGYVQQPTSYGHHTNNTVVVLKDEILIKQNRVSQSHRKKHTR